MHVVSMLADYKEMCAASEQKGKFEAYQVYTSRYPVLFEAVQRYLYQCPLEAMRDYVNASDIHALLHQGEANYKNGLFTKTADFVTICSQKMEIDFSFDLYLGLELGNISGASLPTDDGTHFVYIGMDRPIDQAFLHIFVPHELHHMMRIHFTGERESITLRSRMVSEGLASYCPLWFHGLPWSTDTVSQSLGVKTEQAKFMLEHAESLIKELWDEGDVPLDQAIMGKYFTACNDDRDVRVPGYFAGMWLTHALLERGEDFMHLSKTSTQEILEMLQNRGLV